MKDPCTWVRERLPQHASGSPGGEEDDLEAHLEGCSSCSAELRLLTLLARHRPVAPEGLADRVIGRIDRPVAAEEASATSPARPGSTVGSFPWWGLVAAAATGVALGIALDPPAFGVTDDADPIGPVPAVVAGGGEGGIWLSGDGEVAGVPALEQLTDQELEAFLNDLENGGVA